MKKIYLVVLLALVCNINVWSQLNFTLADTKTYTGQLSNIGGIAINGGEYALVGWEFGLSIVDVTNPNNVVEIVNIPGSQSIWREVKVWNNHAYVTTEAGGGLQIINLNNLPSTNLPVKNYTGNGAIAGQLDNIHALHIEDGYVYLFGSNLFGGSAVICDLSDPWNPNYVGNTPGTYIHDGYVRNDTLYSCHIYDGYFTIFDVTNKANPVAINTQDTPDKFTHNSWLNDAGNVLFTTDEVDNSVLASYDISNPNNIIELDRFQTAPGSKAVVHNTHTLNDYEIVSWYKEGVVVVDVAQPDNMIEVGHYDTSPMSGGGMNGCWGVYPYLPSGTVVVSDIEEGLFVLTPNYVRGCYLHGNVTDSVTGASLSGVKVEILTTPTIKYSKLGGGYKSGVATAGTYTIRYSKLGYITQDKTYISLSNGLTTVVDVKLEPISTVAISGSVIDGSTSQPIANAMVNLTDGTYNYDVTTDNAGNFAISNFITGTYTVTAGKWGYVTDCSNTTTIQGGGNVTVVLQPGWYDDFTFDFGWTMAGTASTGDWVRDEPVGTTTQNNAFANPDVDVNTDCTDKCYVTGNGGGTIGNDDIDNGGVELTSPLFDLSNITAPKIYYSRWIYNGGGQGNPNDTMYVFIDNGTTEVLLEKITATNANISKWTNVNLLISNFITPSATMKVRVYAEDFGQGHVMESAFDAFKILAGNVGINEISDNSSLSVFPNPSNDYFTFEYAYTKPLNSCRIDLLNLNGQVVATSPITSLAGTVALGNQLPAGLYIARMVNDDGVIHQIKVAKTN